MLMTPGPAATYPGAAGTVKRYREGLQRRGSLCELFGETADGDLKQSFEGMLSRFKPDLIHAHDAEATGMQLLGCRIPWVVSVSGEDLYRKMSDVPFAALTCEVYRRAHRVLVPSKVIAEILEERLPEIVGKIDIVPRAVRPLPTNGTDLRRSLGVPRNRLLILLPGGLRPMKGQHRALSLIRILRKAGVDAEMVIVGPVQDEEYAAELRKLVEEEPRIRIIPSLSAERLGATYLDADIVLNTSIEECMSPTILEAGILGRPVIASRVQGNEEIVRHLETGLLFDDEEGMAKSVLALVRNRSAAGAFGVRMREDFKRRFDPEIEIDALLSSYAAA